MPFDEAEVSRDTAGQFAEKRGTAPELSLRSTSGPVSPADQVHAEDTELAREWVARDIMGQMARPPRSSNDRRVQEELARRGDEVQRRAEGIARSNGPRRAFEAGEPHYLDSYIEESFDSSATSDAIMEVRSNITGVRSGGLSPGRIEGLQARKPGKRISKQEAVAQLDEQLVMLQRMMETRGRSNSVIVHNARAAHRRDTAAYTQS